MSFLHDFYCPDCGCTFEEFADGEAAPACPDCGGTAVQRMLAAPHLKTGAPPFKVGPVVPRAPSAPAMRGCAGNCAGCGSSSQN